MFAVIEQATNAALYTLEQGSTGVQRGSSRARAELREDIPEVEKYTCVSVTIIQ